MNRLELQDLHVAYDRRPAVHGISFALGDGVIGCLLGPSGCGKTTVLRAIAGFVEPSQGEIQIAQQTVFARNRSIPTEQRGVGMVFQDFALFPHLNAGDNIGFGLRPWTASERRVRVDELLELVGLSAHRHAFPHELSGGEQQRIALARAMAPRPSVLLLDEPFSSMDVELREQLARDVRDILNQENITAILVTHDQNEAFALADEICVMHAGRIQQRDTSYNLYHHPANRFVADFIGEGVFIDGQVVSDNRIETRIGALPVVAPPPFAPGDEMEILLRPDDIVYTPDTDGDIPVTVKARAFRGSVYLYTLTTESDVELLTLLPSHHYFEPGASIRVRFDLRHLAAFPLSETQQRPVDRP